MTGRYYLVSLSERIVGERITIRIHILDSIVLQIDLHTNTNSDNNIKVLTIDY